MALLHEALAAAGEHGSESFRRVVPPQARASDGGVPEWDTTALTAPVSVRRGVRERKGGSAPASTLRPHSAPLSRHAEREETRIPAETLGHEWGQTTAGTHADATGAGAGAAREQGPRSALQQIGCIAAGPDAAWESAQPWIEVQPCTALAPRMRRPERIALLHSAACHAPDAHSRAQLLAALQEAHAADAAKARGAVLADRNATIKRRAALHHEVWALLAGQAAETSFSDVVDQLDPRTRGDMLEVTPPPRRGSWWKMVEGCVHVDSIAPCARGGLAGAGVVHRIGRVALPGARGLVRDRGGAARPHEDVRAVCGARDGPARRRTRACVDGRRAERADLGVPPARDAPTEAHVLGG